MRGNEADLDEQFVRNLAEKNNVPFHSISFDTQEYSKQEGVSIQMAARELRYNWFDSIKQEFEYHYIATAHHKNDVAETMLINLVKGTGLSGLHGIKSKREHLIRPILNFSRKEINHLVLEEKMEFREDRSNNDIKYVRNRVRNNVIPQLEEINPSIIETLNTEAEQFLELEKIISDKIEEERERLFRDDKGMITIAIGELKKLNPLTSYLYLLLKDYGFNKSDVIDIIHAMDGDSGKRFYSPTHELTKDRGLLLLQENQDNNPELFIIKELSDLEKLPITIKFNIEDYHSALKFRKQKEYAYLDFQKIQFPLILRKWKEGDVFQPYGMEGKKKVSDYLIDNKVPVPLKNKQWVIEKGGEIVWLVGERIDDKYKLTNQSDVVLVLQILN